MGSPPRTSVETSLVDLARVSSEDATVAAVARALAQGRTLPARILTALATRRRTRHSAVLKELCGYAGQGIESALEWRFQTQVLLPHGLPLPEKQMPTVVGRGDALYRDARLAVELDGMRDHTEWSKDMARDNERLLAEDTATLRYGWPAVTLDACAVAAQLAHALSARGWEGSGSTAHAALPPRMRIWSRSRHHKCRLRIGPRSTGGPGNAERRIWSRSRHQIRRPRDWLISC